MNEFFHYCVNCLYRVMEDDYNDKKLHQQKYGCNNLESKTQYHKIEKDFWLQGILEQLDEAENLLIIRSKEDRNLTIDDYDPNLEDKYLLIDAHPRIGYILIDNAMELILYSIIFFTSLKEEIEASNSYKIERFHDKKLNFLFSKDLISEKERNLLIIFHEIRNKLYHFFIPEKFLFLKLANTYLLFCRDLLLKLFNLVYPVKNKKVNTLNFEETDLYALLIDILENEVETLKANLVVQERSVYSSKKDNFAKKFKDFNDYIINLLSDLDSDEFNELLNAETKLRKEFENQNIEPKIKIESLFKTMVKIGEINQILYDDIREYFAYLDYLANIR